MEIVHTGCIVSCLLRSTWYSMIIVPSDVLLLVFENLTGGELDQWPHVQYDKGRAAMPFLLAAVCREWRLLARSTAHLWSYFGFPEDTLQYPGHLARCEVLLAMSKNAPVDVVLFWEKPIVTWSPLGPHLYACGLITRAISDISARWRHVRLRLPLEPMELLRGSLQADLPGLRSLSMVSQVPWNLIRGGSQLSRIYFECLDLGKEAELGHQSLDLPTLTNLAILTDTYHGDKMFRNICAEVGWQLRELCILSIWRDRESLPTLRLDLDMLETLTVVDGTYLNFIHAKNLVNLKIYSWRIPDVVAPANFPRVQSVTLFGDIAPDSFTGLRQLESVSTLVITLPASVKLAYSGTVAKIIPGTWNALNEGPAGPIWPHLKSICILNKNESHKDGYDPDGLDKTVKQRNENLAPSGQTAHIEELFVESANLARYSFISLI